MSLTLPPLFASPFLAPTAPAIGLAQEAALRERFVRDSLPDQFRALTELRMLYFQHRRAGGLGGLAWVDETRKLLIEDVAAEERHREFVAFREDGTAYAQFPQDVAPPPTLNFSEEWGRPEVIPLSPSPRLKTMDLAYFSLGALRFLGTDIDWNEVDAASDNVKHRRKAAPIDVAMAPDRSRFFAEALNRSLAVYLSGIPYILGRVNEGYPGRRGLSLSQVLTAPKSAPVEEAPPAPIVTVLSFRPQEDVEFPPLRTTLRRRGRPCPVVIERFHPERAPLLPENLRSEMFHKLDAEKDGPGRPFFRALRTFDGAFHAVSLSFLVNEGSKIRMRCDRTVKSDLDSANRLQDVGLAFLLSSLQFMKRSGHWHDDGQLLYNLIPRVADAIRRSAGIAGHDKAVVSVALDGISAREGDEFLRKASLKFEPALPPPAAASEAVFLDGRPAG